MAKKKAIQFVPLGRPPKKGEWVKNGDQFYVSQWDRERAEGPFEAHERREVEVDVPDPVPEWIRRLAMALMGTSSLPHSYEDAILAAFRSLVAERAKAAAEAWWVATEYGKTVEVGTLERVIAEEFLK